MSETIRYEQDTSNISYNLQKSELKNVGDFLRRVGLKEMDALVNDKPILYFRAEAFHKLVKAYRTKIFKMISSHKEI